MPQSTPEKPPKVPVTYPYLRHFPDVPVDLTKETDPNLAETGKGRNKIRLNAVAALRRYQYHKENRRDLDILYEYIQECTRAEIGAPEPGSKLVLDKKETAKQLANFLNVFLKDYRVDKEGNADRNGEFLLPPILEIPLDPKIREGRNQIRERAMEWLDVNPEPAEDDSLYTVIKQRRAFIKKFLDLSIKAETGDLYKLDESTIKKELGLDDEEGKKELLEILGEEKTTDFVVTNPTQKQKKQLSSAITGALLIHIDDIKNAEKNFKKKENRDAIVQAARDWMAKYPVNRVTKEIRDSLDANIKSIETLEEGTGEENNKKLIKASKELYKVLEDGKKKLAEEFGSGSERNRLRGEVGRWLTKNPKVKLEGNADMLKKRAQVQELYNLSMLAETGGLYKYTNSPESLAALEKKHGISKKLLDDLNIELPNPNGDNLATYTPFVIKHNNIKIGNALRTALDVVL